MRCLIVLMGTFGYVCPDRTRTRRSYLCATTASDCPLALTSPRAEDWECGLSPRLQNNWVRASPSTAVLMGLSLRCCSPLNGVAKVDVRQAQRSAL